MLPQMFELSVRQVGLVRLIEGLEVVEKCFHHILVEVVVRQELTQSHEYWVTWLFCEQSRDLDLVTLTILLFTLEDANPFEVLLLLFHELEHWTI